MSEKFRERETYRERDIYSAKAETSEYKAVLVRSYLFVVRCEFIYKDKVTASFYRAGPGAVICEQRAGDAAPTTPVWCGPGGTFLELFGTRPVHSATRCHSAVHCPVPPLVATASVRATVPTALGSCAA